VGEPALAGCHLLPAVRADFLSKLGRFAEAKKELERAAGMTQNVKERKMLIRRAEGMR
jgi:RNA polymerase sigma-70 factor (ECF subfamily)